MTNPAYPPPYSTPSLIDYIDDLLMIHLEGECGLGCIICKQDIKSGEFPLAVEFVDRKELHEKHRKMEGYPEGFVEICWWCRDEWWKFTVEVARHGKGIAEVT